MVRNATLEGLTGQGWRVQSLRFAGVGVVATLTHVLVALAASSVLELAPLAANLAGYSVAVMVSFWGHLRVTFKVHDPHVQHLLKFILLATMSLAISSLVTSICTSTGHGIGVAMAAVAVIVPGASFLAARLWVFVPVTEKSSLSGPHCGET